MIYTKKEVTQKQHFISFHHKETTEETRATTEKDDGAIQISLFYFKKKYL
jgi:hypothetical protein